MPNICWCGNANLSEYSKDYFKCDSCLTLISKFSFDENLYHVTDELSNLYGGDYWKKAMVSIAQVHSLNELIDLYLKHRGIYWIQYLMKYALPPGNAVEIGGGLGQFGYLLKQAGFDFIGYEMSRDICEFSKHTLGIEMVCGDFTQSKGTFDCVIAMDLIEHILDAHGMVEAFANHLTPGGVVCLQTPCYDPCMSYDEMLKKKPKFAEQLKAEQHIYLYSRNSINLLLSKHGLTHIVFEPAVFGDDYDMFLFASKTPLNVNDKQAILDRLDKPDHSRLIRTLIQLFEEKQDYYYKYHKSEDDAGQRLQLLHEAENKLIEIETQKNEYHQRYLSALEQCNESKMDIEEIHKAHQLTLITLQQKEDELLSIQQMLQHRDETNRKLASDLQGATEKLSNSEAIIEAQRNDLKASQRSLLRSEVLLWKSKEENRRIKMKNQSIRTLIKQLGFVAYQRIVRRSISPLYIAVDLTPVRIDGSVGGVMHLVLELLGGLVKRDGISILLLCASWNINYFKNLKLKNTTLHQMITEVEGANGQNSQIISNDTSILSDEMVDILFCPFGSPNFHEAGIPVVCTVNDIQHEYYPQFFTEEEYSHRQKFYRDIVAQSSSVICISDYTKKTFCDKYGYPENRTHTIYIAIHDRINKNVDPAILKKYQLTENEFILYPANFWDHKNHRLLLLAFAQYANKSSSKNMKLVLTGNPLDKQDFFTDLLIATGIQEKVVITGYTTQNEMQTLLSSMRGLCFPSLFEGFGIPILEAMSLEKPVACSNTTSLAEIGGDCAYYFNPASVEEICNGIEYLSNAIPDESMNLKYHQLLEKFNKEQMIDSYLDVFYNAVVDGDLGALVCDDLVTGVYPDKWSKPEIGMRVYAGKGAQLLAKMVVPPFSSEARTVTLTYDDFVKEYQIYPGETLNLKVNIKSNNAFIHLKISPPFIPAKDIEGSSDDREVGVIVEKIELKRVNGSLQLLV